MFIIYSRQIILNSDICKTWLPQIKESLCKLIEGQGPISPNPQSIIAGIILTVIQFRKMHTDY